MTTTTERRRNLYAANCYLCGAEVSPNGGYLYQDTSSKAMRDLKYGSGKKTWKIRCELCQKPPKPPKEPKTATPFINGFKRAERKSPIVKKAWIAMVDAGALPENFDASWVDLKDDNSNDAVFLTENKDAVYVVFPSPLSTDLVGNISISAKGVPYATLFYSSNPKMPYNKLEYPVEGETLVGSYGETYYLFPACPFEDMEDWDKREWPTGYLVPQGNWIISKEHEVHWETVRESGI